MIDRFASSRRRDVDAEQYVDRKKTFVGYPEASVAAAEQDLGAKFSRVFRTYLRRMGAAPGDLFVGSHLARLDQLAELRAYALQLLRESGVTDALPANAVSFLCHHAYQVLYVLADGSDDGPVHVYSEGERSQQIAASSFLALVEGELALHESNHRASHESGGFYVAIHDGSVRQIFPALARGERPIDGPDQFIP